VDEVASMLETTVPAINSALQRARTTVHAKKDDPESVAAQPKKSEAIAQLIHAWETGNFERLIAMLTKDAVMSMPPWMYWLEGRDAVVATFLSAGTWQGKPRPGRYRIVATSMNGQPAGLAYVKLAEDTPYVPVCMTVMDLNAEGQVFDMTVFVLPHYFTAWGYPPFLD
jgi:RNA polymerase sigma-70 factor (ECF subfamily)